jgi:hypothetical protein
MRTILTSLKNVLRQPAPDVGVHFHQGPGGMPSPCYDNRCSTPRLQVDER